MVDPRTHRQILREVQEEIDGYTRTGRLAPPAVMARAYRALVEAGDPEKEEYRAALHQQSAHGDRWAQQVLALLCDDPWWRDAGSAL